MDRDPPRLIDQATSPNQKLDAKLNTGRPIKITVITASTAKMPGDTRHCRQQCQRQSRHIPHDDVLVLHLPFHNAADPPVPRREPIGTIDVDQQWPIEYWCRRQPFRFGVLPLHQRGVISRHLGGRLHPHRATVFLNNLIIDKRRSRLPFGRRWDGRDVARAIVLPDRRHIPAVPFGVPVEMAMRPILLGSRPP